MRGDRYAATAAVRAASPGAVGSRVAVQLRERRPGGRVVSSSARRLTLSRSWRLVPLALRARGSGDTVELRVVPTARAAEAPPLAGGPSGEGSVPPGDGGRGLAVGVNTHLLRYAPASRRSILASARGMVVRESISWPGPLAPSEARDWSSTDDFVADVEGAGGRLLPVLKPGLGDAPDDTSRSGYAAWVRAFCLRYRTPLVEIDNEPWNAGEWSATPEQYAAELRAAVDALAGTPCRALVSADLDAWNGPPWIAPLLAAAPDLWSRPEIAGWSVHPYTSPFAPDTSWLPSRWAFSRYRDVLALADAYGPPRPAFLTEAGWTTGGDQAVSEDEQASYTARALAMAEADPRVALLCVYKLHPSPGDAAREGSFALTRPDGSARPALAAVQAAASR